MRLARRNSGDLQNGSGLNSLGAWKCSGATKLKEQRGRAIKRGAPGPRIEPYSLLGLAVFRQAILRRRRRRFAALGFVYGILQRLVGIVRAIARAEGAD